MAPIGSVIKNGLVFAILSAVILFVASLYMLRGITDAMAGVGVGDGNQGATDATAFTRGWIELFISLLLSITIIGIIYMKALSDTVEDGMIEF